jgi:hypothetical protein
MSSDDEMQRLLTLVKKQASEIEVLCRELDRLEKLITAASSARSARKKSKYEKLRP